MLKDNIYSENLYDTYDQHFTVDEMLFEAGTEHQHLVADEGGKLVNNGEANADGRVDSIITLTERCSTGAVATRYFNLTIHQAAFALPHDIEEAITKAHV